MSVYKYYEFKCDTKDCPAFARLEGRNMAALRLKLAKEGWSWHYRHGDRCSHCTQELQELTQQRSDQS